MGPLEWYHARGDRHQGPVSAAELKRMATAGQLRPEDLVWREGMAEWTSARNVRGLFEEINEPAGVGGPNLSAPPQVVAPSETADRSAPAAPAVSPPPSRRPTPTPTPAGRHPFDALLAFLRRKIPERLVEVTARFFERAGHYGLYAGMVLCLLLGIVLTVKLKQGNVLLFSLATVLALAVLQYIAGKFFRALQRLNQNTTAAISSSAVPDCFALLNLLLGLWILPASLVLAIQGGMLEVFLFGLGTFTVCQCLALIALHPDAIRISSDPDLRASEEAVGVLMFLLKAFLRLTPVAFGVGILLGCVLEGYALIQISTYSKLELLIAQWTAETAHVTLLYSAALPLLAYLAFLLLCFLIDLSRAILLLPGKQKNDAEEDGKPENTEGS